MSKVMSGSRIALKLNGKKIAYAGGVQVSEENTLTDIDVLDMQEVAEHAETGHKVNFSCSIFRIDGNSAIELGLSPSNLRDILSQPEMTAEIYDSVGDKVRYTMSGVKFEGGDFSVDARGVWNGNFRFKARIGRGM